MFRPGFACCLTLRIEAVSRLLPLTALSLLHLLNMMATKALGAHFCLVMSSPSPMYMASISFW